MKRALMGLVLLALAACQPPAVVEQQVMPTLISATIAQDGSRVLTLQGRYLGDGQGGLAENSYVLMGASMEGVGGVRLRENMQWTPTRVSFRVPQGIPSGYVFVVVDGQRSTGLPVSLP